MRSQASGIIIMSAWRMSRPLRTRSSSWLSSLPLSLPWVPMMGFRLWMASPQTGLARSLSRARIQFSLPWRVLISPLWQMSRKGWARSQVGKVLVL